MPGDLSVQAFENAVHNFNAEGIDQYLRQPGRVAHSKVIEWATTNIAAWSDFGSVIQYVDILFNAGANDPDAWNAFLKKHLANEVFSNSEHELVLVKRCYVLMPTLILEPITDQVCRVYQQADTIMGFLFEAGEKVDRGLACLIEATLKTPHLRVFLERLVQDHLDDLHRIFSTRVYDKSLIYHLFSHKVKEDILDYIYEHVIKPNLDEHWDRRELFLSACRYGCAPVIEKFLTEYTFHFDEEGNDGALFGREAWNALMGSVFEAWQTCLDDISDNQTPGNGAHSLVDQAFRVAGMSLLIVDGGLDLSMDGVLASVNDIKGKAGILVRKRSLDHSLRIIAQSIEGWCNGIALIADLQQKEQNCQMLLTSLEANCPTLPFNQALKARCCQVFDEMADHFCQIVSRVSPDDEPYVREQCRDEVQRYQEGGLSTDDVDGYIKRFLDYAKAKKILTMEEYQYHRLMCEVTGHDEPEVIHRQHSGFKPDVWEASENSNKFFAVHETTIHALPLLDVDADPREVACDKIVLALLTSLFYHLKSSRWDAAVCVELRQWIAMIRDDLPEGADQTQYEVIHEDLEASGYCAECPSDDSDDESCEVLAARPLRERNALRVSAERMMDHGQVQGVWTADRKKFRKPQFPGQSGSKSKSQPPAEAQPRPVDPIGPALGAYNVTARAEIHHDGEIPSSVHRDLSTLNQLVMQDNFNEATSGQIATQFFVAQYRGVHYETNQWPQSQRQRHRLWDERNHPSFSRAAELKAGITIEDMMQGLDGESSQKLDKSAALLKHQLTCLRFTGPIRSQYTGKDGESFRDASLALQDFYTKKYDAHKGVCEEVHAKKNQSKRIRTAAEAAFLFSQGHANYNVSTGDTPYHPLRYALGLKSYGKGKDHRLRPRWRQSGQAERPYSGKVYTFLCTVQMLHELGPAHLISLNHQGDLSIGERILAERESTFHASLPAGSVMDAKTLKYPDFSRDFDEYYHPQRYGLDRKMYDAFKKQICDSLPHSQDRKTAKFLLGEHLCAYHEVCLIEDARLEAKRRDGWLVYRDAYGGYSLVPPEISPASVGGRAQAGRAQRDAKDERVAARSEQPLGDFETLMGKYDVIPGDTFNHVLIAMGVVCEDDLRAASIDGIPDELVEMYLDCFKKEVLSTIKEGVVKACLLNHLKRLLALSRIKSTHRFELHSFLLKKPIVIGGGDEVHAFLYLGGDGFHGLKEKLPPSAAHGAGSNARFFAGPADDRKREGAAMASNRDKRSRAGAGAAPAGAS